MKVLVSDPLSEKGIEILKRELEVDVETGLSQEELIEKIPDYDALVVRSGTKVTREVIEAGRKLKIIGRAGVGVDNIDVEAATNRGIIVVNAPEGNTISAAEHTIAMLLALSRNIPQANASTKQGRWERKKFMGVEVRGKTIGIIGLGRVGAEVASRAQGLEMKVLAYDPFISQERAEELGVTLASIEEIVERSDFITVHTPLTPQTENLIDRDEFERMKPDVRVINCARGGIINEEALYHALKTGRIAGAALDVFVEEPPQGSPLLGLDNLIVTPHLGASTREAQVNVAVSVAEEIVSALKGGPVKNAINLPRIKPEQMKAISPFMTLAEKLGNMGVQLLERNYNKVEIRYHGEIAEKDVKPITIAALKGLLEPVMKGAVNYVNAPAIARERKIKVVESKSKTPEYYPDLVSLHLHTDQGGCRKIAGTIVNGEPRIVDIDCYRVDVIPKGHLLVAKHKDHPNIIGPCCLILGRNQINIAGMQVGRLKPGGDAIMVLSVDSEIKPEILKEIEKVDGILEAKLVNLS